MPYSYTMDRPGTIYKNFWKQLICDIEQCRPDLAKQLRPSEKAGIKLEGRPRAKYCLWWSGKQYEHLRAEFIIPNCLELYDFLERHKSDIETNFGGRLAWEPMEGKAGCRIGKYHRSTHDLRQLPEAADTSPWILEVFDRLRAAIDPVLREYPDLRAESQWQYVAPVRMRLFILAMKRSRGWKTVAS